jgi:flagellar biosynthetic protein FlhB
MSDENGEKTELPTDRRRTETREQGNVARSVDLNSAALLMAAACAMQFCGVPFISAIAQFLDGSLRGPAWVRLDQGLLLTHFRNSAEQLLPSLLSLMLVMAAASLASNFMQVGFLLSTESLQPKLSRLNPLEGVKRIFSMRGLVKLAGSLSKLLVLSTVSLWFIWTSLDQYLSLSDFDVPLSAAVTARSIVSLAFWMASTLLVLALLDYGFQFWQFEQDLKMTKQEVREEMRQMEGDPQIRMRRREAHRKLTDSRQEQAAKQADAIITNPTEIAIAIKYNDQTMAAPIVIAKGMGLLAARIRRVAAEHSIPIIENKPLARNLYQNVKVGEAVPVELYEAIAEILAYIYRLKGKAPKPA